ncbi:unnamed protein product, partial [Tetraodon nigroviridis]
WQRRAGLLHPAEHHAPAAPAGGARGRDPGGPADGGPGAEGLRAGVRAEGQAHGAGREADPRGSGRAAKGGRSGGRWAGPLPAVRQGGEPAFLRRLPASPSPLASERFRVC